MGVVLNALPVLPIKILNRGKIMRSIFLVLFLVVMGSALTLVIRAQDQSQDQNPKGVIKAL